MARATLPLHILAAALMVQTAAAETIPLPQPKPDGGVHTDKP
ncbi:sel1 repeat family protein, partial [Mesorhizobium sp. M2D.F.Ca.ET.140.01.1.1]